MKLREYQEDAVAKIAASLRENKSALACLPTGTGKTVILSSIVKMASRGRVLVIAHREELITQLANTIRGRGVEVGIEMASRRSTDKWWTPPECVVATVQTLMQNDGKRLKELVPDPEAWSLTVIDEAHHAPANTYRKLVEHMQSNESHRLLGVTATPDRTDETAMGLVFEAVAFQYQIDEAIDDGWLVPIEQRSVIVDGLTYDKVRTTAGDLNGRDLARVMEEELTIQRMAVPTFELAAGRPTVMFCASVEQAERMAEVFNRMAPDCARSVSGKTPKDERRKLFRDFSEGGFQILTNCMVASEGWDAPHVQVVALGRPTKSRALFTQMVGRGLRPLPGIVDGQPTPAQRQANIAMSAKPYCDVIDFVGNAGRHSLVCVTDILGGKYPDEVRARAKEILQSGEEVSPEAALEEAAASLAEEQERRRLAEAARRARLRAQASYRTETYDPFKVLGVARPQHPGAEPASVKQLEFLQKFGVDGDRMSRAEATKLQRSIFKRMREGKCTLKQARLLARYGYPTDMSIADASSTLDRLAANGWRRPHGRSD